ncbi:polysaccharide biosynthesis/export family protein [Wenzhouxiangella sediminis]|jgi:polysaccharide export outer membrane protein|nr:polysaccharide biosynthesis/export family protein [Wenzhouxiangella sediminis]MEE4303044.1 polysaccharide biosynthesis/export family protein [Wenzhouxiangella sp.]
MIMFKIREALLVMATLSALLMAGCASGPSAGPVPPSSLMSMAVEDYRIGVDDVVQVSVWRREDLGVTVPVRSDGKITVPLIGDIQAGGLRPEEVADNARGLLADYIREPNVTVIVTELRSHEYLSRVRVTGAVRSPVSLPHRQGMTVLDAVLAAGGPNEYAAADRSALHRHLDKGGFESYALPLRRILEQGDLSANHVLMPGDVITVPQRNF